MRAEAALDLCKQLGDRLVIAYAYEPPGRMVGEEFKEHRRALEEMGDEMTRVAIEHARAEGVQAQVELVAERPARALRRLGEQYYARMIVVGTQGESPLRSAILGSIPHKLLQISERPVLVIPPDGDE